MPLVSTKVNKGHNSETIKGILVKFKICSVIKLYCVKILKHLTKGNQSYSMDTKKKCNLLIKRHMSEKKIKGIITKLKLDLCIVDKNIV